MFCLFVRRLLTEVDALKSNAAAAAGKPAGDKMSASQADSQHVLYELRYRPEEAKFSSTARVCVRALMSQTVVGLQFNVLAA